jgi:ribosomal protein S18 acetylase RimI-like enzyme
MLSNYRFRSALPNDVPALLDLMVMSSFGGISEAWQRAKSHGETWQQRGFAELSDSTCEIGYSRFVVAETHTGSAGQKLAGQKLAAEKIAGMILLNVVGDTSLMNPRLEPLEQAGAVALIKAAEHSLFIREFAIAEWARGQGLSKEFLALTERLAISNGLKRVTLIVNDANLAAHGLYKKSGFKAQQQQPSIAHPHFPDSSTLVLMDKAVSAPKIS